MLSFLKKEPVLSAAAAAAVISAFFVPPNAGYIGYINFSVLILLFCLMTVVAGLMETKLFDVISAAILRSSDSSRNIAMMLVNITFFSAMLITNDVALITLVPFTVGLFSGNSRKCLVSVVVMETVAANLGSMIMPFGNPQNLYLYSEFNMSMGEFSEALLPYGLLSLALVNIVTFFLVKNVRIESDRNSRAEISSKKKFAVYVILFSLCVLTVLRLVNVYVCLAVTAAVCLAADRKLFARVDYFLLLTFCAFFIFVGNLAMIEPVKNALSSVVTGNEYLTGILASQIISNVPAAIMLSGFTENAGALLLGVDIGGLGTLVASLASVISWKQYSKSEGADMKKYLGVFSAVNFSMLAFITAVYYFVKLVI